MISLTTNGKRYFDTLTTDDIVVIHRATNNHVEVIQYINAMGDVKYMYEGLPEVEELLSRFTDEAANEVTII